MQKESKMNPSQSDIEEQVKYAFREVLITGKIGYRIPKKAFGAYWDIFYKSLGWRFDKLFEGIDKRHSKYPKCLFVQIPRTGTGSINSILQQKGGHKTSVEWRKKFSIEQWKNMFKFSVVRDPYERFLSGYYHIGKYEENVNKFLADGGMEKVLAYDYTIFRPQYHYLYEGADILVDSFGKFEDLNNVWKVIADKVGIKEKLPHLNPTTSDKQKLNGKSKDILYKFYQRDFELLGYKR